MANKDKSKKSNTSERKAATAKAGRRSGNVKQSVGRVYVGTPQEVEAYAKFIDAEAQLLIVQGQINMHMLELCDWADNALGEETPVRLAFHAMIWETRENHVPTEALFMQYALRMNLDNRLTKLRAMRKFMAQCENSVEYWKAKAGKLV